MKIITVFTAGINKIIKKDEICDGDIGRLTGH